MDYKHTPATRKHGHHHHHREIQMESDSSFSTSSSEETASYRVPADDTSIHVPKKFGSIKGKAFDDIDWKCFEAYHRTRDYLRASDLMGVYRLPDKKRKRVIKSLGYPEESLHHQIPAGVHMLYFQDGFGYRHFALAFTVDTEKREYRYGCSIFRKEKRTECFFKRPHRETALRRLYKFPFVGKLPDDMEVNQEHQSLESDQVMTLVQQEIRPHLRPCHGRDTLCGRHRVAREIAEAEATAAE